MRLLVLSIALANAALMSAADPASAQSAYSYPWCARVGSRDGPTSCYYNSYEHCLMTLSGVGGYCFKSPYYQGPPPGRDKAVKARRPRHP
jgi:Protein of unknown function (DUF3551)